MYFRPEPQNSGLEWPTPPTPGDLSSRTAVASYVASPSADLATMTRRTGLETLSYLLEMVRLEAESVSRHNGQGG